MRAKTESGYEISFTRYFYKPVPLRTLEEIRADILAFGAGDRGVVDGDCGFEGCVVTDEEPGLSSIEVERLYRDVASGRLTDQLEVAETHQHRIASLMTIGSIVLPLTAGVLTSDSVDLEKDSGQAIFLTLAVIAYGGLVACFYFASRLSKWDTRPKMDQWGEVVTPERTETELLNWLGTAYIEAFHTNRPQLERKGQWAGWGVLFLTAEVACLSVAVLLPLVSRWT